MAGEKETLGLYLTGHPIDRYEDDLAGIASGRIAALTGGLTGSGEGADGQERAATVAGLVMAMRTVNTRRGRMAILTLDDRTARLEATLFPEVFEKYRHLLGKDTVLVLQGQLGPDDYSGGWRLATESLYTVDQARELYARRLVIHIAQEQGGNGFVDSLAQVLTPYREGRCPVWIHYRRPDAEAHMPLGEAWRVRPTDELLARLRALAGERGVSLDYGPTADGRHAPLGPAPVNSH